MDGIILSLRWRNTSNVGAEGCIFILHKQSTVISDVDDNPLSSIAIDSTKVEGMNEKNTHQANSYGHKEQVNATRKATNLTEFPLCREPKLFATLYVPFGLLCHHVYACSDRTRLRQHKQMKGQHVHHQ